MDILHQLVYTIIMIVTAVQDCAMLFSLQKSWKNRWKLAAILRDGNFAEILWKLGEALFFKFLIDLVRYNDNDTYH